MTVITLPLSKRANAEPVQRSVRANFIAFLLLVVPLGAGVWLTMVSQSLGVCSPAW